MKATLQEADPDAAARLDDSCLGSWIEGLPVPSHVVTSVVSRFSAYDPRALPKPSNKVEQELSLQIFHMVWFSRI